MLLAGVEEQFGLIGRVHQGSGGAEIAVILGEEGVGVHAVDLDGHVCWPRFAAFGYRCAGVEEERSLRSGPGRSEMCPEAMPRTGMGRGVDLCRPRGIYLPARSLSAWACGPAGRRHRVSLMTGRVGWVRVTSVNPASVNMATVPVKIAEPPTRAALSAGTSTG